VVVCSVTIRVTDMGIHTHVENASPRHPLLSLMEGVWRMSKRALSLSFASLLVIVAGAVHGVCTDRWGTSSDLHALVEHIRRVPQTIGEWEGKDVQRSDREWRAAGAVGHLDRVYTRRSDGARVTVMLVAGRGAEISSHTPEVCYPSAGYSLEGFKRIKAGPSPGAAFFTARAVVSDSNATNGGHLRIFWSWNNGVRWEAPDDPRLSYMGRRALTKLYVVVETDGTEASEAPAREFLSQLLPALDREFFPAGATSQPGSTS
jgi:hypothetical protein